LITFTWLWKQSVVVLTVCLFETSLGKITTFPQDL
jgi:hypothetical protein